MTHANTLVSDFNIRKNLLTGVRQYQICPAYQSVHPENISDAKKERTKEFYTFHIETSDALRIYKIYFRTQQ